MGVLGVAKYCRRVPSFVQFHKFRSTQAATGVWMLMPIWYEGNKENSLILMLTNLTKCSLDSNMDKCLA